MQFFTDYTNLALLVAAMIAGGLLLWPSLMRRGRDLSVQQATQFINHRNATVIDLRTAAEYGQGHLPQARHVAWDALSSKVMQIAKNKAHPVLLTCQTGRRSHQALAVLKQAGYTEVFVLQGGLAAWQQAGMPVIK